MTVNPRPNVLRSHDFGLTLTGPGNYLLPYCSCGWIGKTIHYDSSSEKIRAEWLVHFDSQTTQL